MDVRLLNYSHATIVSLIHKPLIIEMHKYRYFNPNQLKQKVEQPSKYQTANQVDLQYFKPHSELNITPNK